MKIWNGMGETENIVGKLKNEYTLHRCTVCNYFGNQLIFVLAPGVTWKKVLFKRKYLISKSYKEIFRIGFTYFKLNIIFKSKRKKYYFLGQFKLKTTFFIIFIWCHINWTNDRLDDLLVWNNVRKDCNPFGQIFAQFVQLN